MRSAKFSKIVIFFVCILLVFAVAAALLFDGAALSASGNVIADSGEGADEANSAYPVSADGYTHGSNIGRATSGTNVNSASAFISALNSNSNINITGSFTMSSSYAFSHSGTYSGTIYGNGYTISYSGPHSNNSCTGNYSSDSSIGALVSVLSGKIYDLNVNFTGGQAAFAITSGGGNINVGGIVGYLNGGTIENCTMTFSGSGMRLGAATWSSSYGSWPSSKDSWPAVGAIAGKMAGGSTIKNVTVKSASSSNYIVAGVAARGSSTSSLSIDNTKGTASMLAGYIDGGISTVDDIVIEGNGTVKGFYGSLLGMSASGSTSISTTNFYNKFEGTLDTTSNGNGASYVKYNNSGSVSVSNMYKSSNAYDSNGTWAGTISNRVTVNTSNYTVGFDPKASSIASSLVIVKTGVTGGEDYSATITSANNTQYANNYAFSSNGSTVIFRNLPTAISNWGGNGGKFSCTINITQDAIQVDELDPVNKWESSYCSTKVNTGTAVSDGAGLASAIAANSGDIYLTKDITDFTGFNTSTFSHNIYGNGYTVYIVKGNANTSGTVGGLMGTLSGTVKDLRVVLYSSYNRTVSTTERGTGIVAGVINGGTVDNVYVYIPENVTFGVTGNVEGYVGAIAGFAGVAGVSDTGNKVDGANYTIKNTTVDIDGKMHLDGSYVYLAGFVGKTSTGSNAVTAEITNCVFKGNGSFASASSNSTEPIYLGGTTVLFQKETGNPQSTININGFINAFKGGETNLTGGYSMYGVLSKNDNGNKMTKWTWNVSGVYDYNSPWGDINKKNTGNDYIDISNYRSTVSTTVDGSSIKVIPYFPAGDTTNLVLVAGDGSQSVPDLAYGDYKSTTDGSYKVVTVPKSAISAGSTVTLAEPVTPATPIADMNKWENGYVESSDVVPDGYTAVSDGAELANAIAANANIFLTADIMDYVGFNSASETDGGYSGIFDGNGHTVYIVKANTVSKQYVGGFFGKLKGTVKDVRIVVMAGVDLPSTTYVGAVAGALSGNANVSNVNVIINSGVNLVISGSSSNVGGAGGIAGGLTSGSGETVTISNSTVVLNGTLKATAQYTFIAGFVGHLNGGSVNYTDLTFKGNGMLDGVANAGEGVHTAGAGIVGGGVSAVNVNGFINSFNGSLSNGRSAYEVVVRNSQSTSISVNVSNVYTYGTVTTYDGSMDYGKPVACDKSTIATTVADSDIPVTPYFPVTNSGELVLVAGDGKSECPFVTYESYEGMQDGKYMVVSVPKTEITASSTVQLIQGKSPVGDPSISTAADDLVYNGGEITIAINQLMSGTTALGESDYTVVITANGGNALVQNGKPVNAGEYTLTVTLLNGYEFEGGKAEKTIPFTVTPFVISGSLAVSGSAVYDKTEKTVIFTADENKGLFNGDNVVISYNDGDRVNVTEAGFTATATVPNGNYTFEGGNAISAEFTITAKELTVVWGETSFTYDGSEKAPTAEVNEGVIEGDSVTLSVSGAETNAGSGYTATATISPANANYALANGTIQFSIAKAKVSVSGANATAEYRATEYTEDEIKAAVFADGMPDVATTTVTVTPASVINAGDIATVTVALIDGDNYEFEAGAITQFTFTVTAKEISLPEASANKSAVYSPSTSYNAAKITELIFGTASIDNVTVKVMNGDVEISGDTSVSDAGVYTVTAAANKNYVFVVDTVTQYTFEITKAPITLGVSVADWIYGNQASAPVITGNDGNGTVTYLYTGTEYSDAVAPTNAGTYSLEITVAETANYQGGKASCEFTIEKATVTVPTIEDKVYTGEPLVADVSETDYYEVTKNDGGSEVATYEVVLTLKDAANYKWSDGTQTADITLEFHIVASGNSWTIPLSIVGWTYGKYSADVNAPVYKAEKGNDTAVVEVRLKTGTDADYATVADLSTLGAGDYYMRVRVPKTEEYGGLSTVVEFTVSKAAISVTVSIDGWTYGDEAKTPSVSGNTASGAVTYSYVGTGVTDYEESETAPVNAGTYKLTATVAETENYFGATAETEFAIAKKAITATVTAETATYDGAEHVATVSFDGKVGEDELTAELLYNGNAENPVNAGSYTVTVQSYGGAAVDNYDITTKDGEVKLVISPKKLYIDDIETAAADPSDNGIYDGKEHAVKATVKYGVLYGDDVVTLKVLYNGSEDAPVNAGNYTLTFVVTDNGNYVMAEDQSKTVPVLKAKVSVKGVNAAAVYTGEAFTEEQMISAVFGDADLSLVNVTVTYRQGDAAVNTGDIADIAITLKDAANYEFAAETTTTYTFTVTAGTVRLDGEDKTVEYKGTAYTDDEIKNAIFGEGTWEKFVIEISYNNGAALNAGDTATVTVTGYVDPNYALDPEMTKTYTFTVTTLKVDAPALAQDSFVYNGAEQTVSLTDDTYVAISENVKTDKGDYKAVAALIDKNNYEWTTGGKADVELPWSITAKEITLKAETSVDKTYDGEAYDFGKYVVTGAEGFYARDNVIVTVSAGNVYTPGSYVITVTHDANANYNVTVDPTDAKLTIKKADLTIAAKNAEIEYTGKVVKFEFEITGGKVGQDDVEIDVVTYKQNGVAVAPQETGTYDVTFTLKGAQAAYYTANATQVKVTPQTATAPDGMTSESIVLPADDDMIYDGEAHVAILDYTATDGNTYGIIYHNGTTYVDEAVDAGEYTVYVYKNIKINLVENVSRKMTVQKKVLSADDISVGGLGFTYSGTSNKVTATAVGVKDQDVTLKTLYDGEETAPVDAGTYTVTFASADGNYVVAEDVSYQMTVAKANVATPVAKNLKYNALEQTAFENDAANRYTVGGVFKATDVSADGYTATFTLVSDNYKWADLDDEQEKNIDVVWNIAPYGVTIEISEAAKTKVYNGVALTEEELKALFVAPQAIGGGNVAITVTTANDVEVRDTAVYDVTAKVADINYTADACVVVYTVTIATPTVNVQVQEKLMQVGDKLSTVGISLAAGSTPGTIVWENPDTLLVEGDNKVTWTFTPDDTVNYTGTSGKVTLTVGNEILTGFTLVSGPDKTVYNAFDAFDPAGITLEATFEGIEEVQPVTVAECEITFDDVNASVDRLTAKVTEVTLTYGNMSVTVTVTVEKLTVEIPTLDKTELEYNAQEQTVNVPEDARYYMAGGNVGTNVGSYNAAVALTDNVNYKWSDGTSENKELAWKITPVTLSVEITLPDNLVYDGTAKVATFALTDGTLYGGAQISLAYELRNGTVLDGAPVNAGEYVVVAKLPDTDNYRFSADTEYAATMTIAKKTVTITTNGDREKYYDGIEVTTEQLADNFSVTDGLGITVSVSGTVLNVGTYTVTAQIDPANTNYTAEQVSYRFSVRKGNREVDATITVGYRTVEISADGVASDEIEYSLDGNVWEPYTGAIQVKLQAVYEYYVRYAENSNYNPSAQVKVSANVTKDALMQYVNERFTDETELADAEDIAFLETLAAAADGDNAEFDAALKALSEERATLVNGASDAVRNALATGGKLAGYNVATTVAIALGGISLCAAAALGVAVKRKGGKKNEEK